MYDLAPSWPCVHDFKLVSQDIPYCVSRRNWRCWRAKRAGEKDSWQRHQSRAEPKAIRAALSPTRRRSLRATEGAGLCQRPSPARPKRQQPKPTEPELVARSAYLLLRPTALCAPVTPAAQLTSLSRRSWHSFGVFQPLFWYFPTGQIFVSRTTFA